VIREPSGGKRETAAGGVWMSKGEGPLEQMPSSRRVRELELMVEITRRLTSTLDQEKLLKLITTMASELVDCEDASIIWKDRRTGELVFLAAAGPKSDELKNVRFPVEGSIGGTVFKTQEPLIVQDTESDPRHYDQVDSAIDFETQSVLAVPMMFQDRPIGVLEGINKRNGGRFNDHDVQILSTLAAQAAVAIANAQLVEDLKEANAQLSELDRLKSDFIAIASHELRTPLTLILGYASFLREDASEETAPQIDVILQAATQLKSLIEDMFNLSNIEAGSAELNLSEFSLQSVIQECTQAQQAYAASKSIGIRPKMPEQEVRVRADREKIGIALNNLIDNAIKFTPTGGHIQVAVRPQAGMVAVTVADTGIGIPEDEEDRVFERFHQVESHLTRNQGGMGLGLSIARGMIELHGGRIWVDSVEGQGSRFTFILPILWKDVTPHEA
jgi:signal transduction histidine kinase